MRKRWLLIISSVTVGFAAGLIIFYGEQGSFPQPGQYWQGYILLIMYSIAIGFLLDSSSKVINGRILWEKSVSWRFISSFISNTLLLGVAICAITLMIFIRVDNTSVTATWNGHSETFIKAILLSTVIALFYTILSFLQYAYYHYEQGQIAVLIQDRKQLKLQFEALKNQLSPHYLFNSLNTISSLIHTDTEKAEQFIRRLSDTYTFVLNTRNKRLVSISEEVEFVKSYFYLLRIRFDQGIKLKIDIPDKTLKQFIPPLTLQILLENAIKHNVFSNKDPLTIHLKTIGDDRLKLTNNKTSTPMNITSMKVGLNNIKNRYAFFTTKKVLVSDDVSYEVSVPVLSDSISTTWAA